MAFWSCKVRVLTERDKEQTLNACAMRGSKGPALNPLGGKQEYELAEVNLTWGVLE